MLRLKSLDRLQKRGPTINKPADLAGAGSVIGLDVGGQRIGVAVASLTARLPRPLLTLANDETFFPALEQIMNEEAAVALVVGLPRNLQGEHTEQTRLTEVFTSQLKRRFAVPVYYQDEALTSRQAEAELQARGRQFEPADIDALAAVYILEDFLRNFDGEVR